jgi:hypothetical protein
LWFSPQFGYLKKFNPRILEPKILSYGGREASLLQKKYKVREGFFYKKLPYTNSSKGGDYALKQYLTLTESEK